MEDYTWTHKEYVFRLTISDERTRWEGTGILQYVTLSINGFTVFNNNWGRENNLERYLIINDDDTQHIYKNKNSINVLNRNDNNKLEYIALCGEDAENFNDWMIFSLSKKPQQIKRKIEKILNR